MTTTPDATEIVIPALLRAARGTYARAIRSRLTEAGCEDVPRDGAYVLGGMVNHGGSAGNLIREMGITKQAASALIDTLVLRGYLERQVNPEDRRRMTINVTEHGRAAAIAIRAGIMSVDAELAHLISPAELAGFRAGLVALIDIKERWEGSARSTASFDAQ